MVVSAVHRNFVRGGGGGGMNLGYGKKEEGGGEAQVYVR